MFLWIITIVSDIFMSNQRAASFEVLAYWNCFIWIFVSMRHARVTSQNEEHEKWRILSKHTNFLILESNVMPIYSPINIIIGLQTIASTRYSFVNILTCFTDNTCPLSPLLSLQLLSVTTTSKTDCMSACESDVNCYAIISYSNSHCLLMGKSKPSTPNLEAHVAIRKCIKGKIRTFWRLSLSLVCSYFKFWLLFCFCLCLLMATINGLIILPCWVRTKGCYLRYC